MDEGVEGVVDGVAVLEGELSDLAVVSLFVSDEVVALAASVFDPDFEDE